MKNQRISVKIAAVLLACIASAGQAQEQVDFNRDIRPLLSDSCLICHGPHEAERAADLRLDTEAGSREDLGGYAAIVPGDAEASELIARLSSDDEDLRMPPEGKGRRFTEDEIQLVRRWIQQGADYARHWSYVKPSQPEIPAVENSDWPINPIDHFILARLEAEGLHPSPAADRLTLARRVSLDLTGLPPTWREANEFASDPSEHAYEAYVDRLLAKPSFGERWAQVWLDLARYADSAGYADDPPRTIWAYRDYVIRSLNENKPFDQFTIEQIAGDLIENPSDEQLIATAFHRNTTTNNEGGTNDEEFRNVAVVDRVNTTMAVWMGTTMACAQCHTHKYDPITHDEYFQFFAFFNNTEDADRKDENPILEVWSDEQRKQKEQLHSKIAKLQDSLDQTATAILAADPQSPAGATEELNGKPVDPVLAIGKPRQFNVSENEVVTGLRLEIPSGEKEALQASNISLHWSPAESQPISARFVRIDLPGEGKMIHLAELQVFSGSENIAIGSKPTQSSTGFGGKVEFAIDGNTNGDYAAGSVSHTAVEKDPWLELDLGETHEIDSLAIWNRTDGEGSLQSRLAGFTITLLDEKRHQVWIHIPQSVPSPSAVYAVSGGSNLSFVALPQAAANSHSLTLALTEPLREAGGVLSVRFSNSSATAEGAKIALTGDELLSRWATQQDELESLKKQLPALVPETTVPVLRELPVDQRRTTHVHRRGSYLSEGNEVSAGTPVAFHPLVPHAGDSSSDIEPTDRMLLARWLVDDDNPLTPRVIANRHWEQIFGIGLVETSEEFGSQGELPSHPELLDYLAVQLRDHGWDLKNLLRLIVTSATYRQSSLVTEELEQADPANRLLARGPRFRASAEMVRDQALFVSGLLSDKMYGPPVRPVQPDIGLRAAFGSATDWTTSQGADQYRRGLYTTWRRSSPYPSMAQFDAPNGEVCTVRRIRTNTPLQALVTLNDPVYIEAAQALARRIVSAEPSTEKRIAFAFHHSLLREPSEAEVSRLSRLEGELIEYYRAHPADADAIATQPLGPIPEPLVHNVPLDELATWTVLSNVILNLDEMLMKR